MTIQHHADRRLTTDEFIDVLMRSTLAERRPVDDPASIQAMLDHANLLCTAWDGAKLVGVARSVTDFAYCCYLSVLAIDAADQRKGLGKELIASTQSLFGLKARLTV
jgi:ribosomal protein S18 acetylase RimI-like enzyme